MSTEAYKFGVCPRPDVNRSVAWPIVVGLVGIVGIILATASLTAPISVLDQLADDPASRSVNTDAMQDQLQRDPPPEPTVDSPYVLLFLIAMIGPPLLLLGYLVFLQWRRIAILTLIVATASGVVLIALTTFAGIELTAPQIDSARVRTLWIGMAIGTAIVTAAGTAIIVRLTSSPSEPSGGAGPRRSDRESGETARESGAAAPFDIDATPTSNAVYRAWEHLAVDVAGELPSTMTPGEVAQAAVERGHDPAAVDRLTALFVEVRYGTVAVTAEREQRAKTLSDHLSIRSDEGHPP